MRDHRLTLRFVAFRLVRRIVLIHYYNNMNNTTREMKERYSPLRFSQSAPRIEHDRRGIPRKIGLDS